MSNQLLIPDMDNLARLAKMVTDAGYFGNDPAQAAVKILAGVELGLGPINALRNLHVVQGQVTMSAGLVSCLVKRSPRYNYRVLELTDTTCALAFQELNGDGMSVVGESTFTMEDAKRAGLLKSGGSWDKWPKAMLFARAMTQGARMYCPDVFGGPIYTGDEIDDTQPVKADFSVDEETGEVKETTDEGGE